MKDIALDGVYMLHPGRMIREGIILRGDNDLMDQGCCSRRQEC